MEMDYKALAHLAWEQAGSSISALLGALGIGLLVTIAIIILYGRLGVFRRTYSRTYHWLAKLWIPYMLIVGVLFAFKLGTLRAIDKAVVAANTATVEALYDHAVSPFVGDENVRRAILTEIQQAAGTAQGMGRTITTALKQKIAPAPGTGPTLSQRMGNMVAAGLIDHYEEDITAAVMYGVYLKSGDYLHLHHSGEPMEYHDFKVSVDELMKIDVVEMERSIKTNLSALTGTLIERQYRSMFKGTLLMGILLLLLPLVEWGIYRWVMYNKAVREVSAAEEAPAPPGA